MPSKEQQYYRGRTVDILTSFQLLEFILKTYIGEAYNYIHRLVEDRIHFGFSIKDVETYPLERLLNVFDKLNRNEDLKKRLNKLRKQRNYIAHEALLVSLGSHSDMDTLYKKAEEFFYLEDELSECLDLLTKELGLLPPIKSNE
ncbi:MULTISPECIES: hypothetical protein [Halomonadaceae]|uniref:hypothetical protein n=1 Tax=Halomonadaceae TaxID=28256 RepID=UPI0012F3A2CA|nr:MULTISPECIES: hypothetical protein [Halomonas]CAD5267986.1 conserved hypothetical protein [Halomonas sp. I3]CAD5273724.1 conserved hypothetical protein [Halomonas sp. 113]CAD5275340.1 conserved hypothetical protein [Halomonas sp. 59]CAD5278257.1 conserved hypothetical protein [Halomonas sp. 156]VXB93068.1 conserved hypothetical protein [Halomonas titanicae]